MDVGEQDGRYAGGYANQIARRDASRQEQYVYLWRHFDRMSADLKDKLSALTSVYYPHYLVKVRMFFERQATVVTHALRRVPTPPSRARQLRRCPMRRSDVAFAFHLTNTSLAGTLALHGL